MMPDDMSDRFLAYAVRIVEFVEALPETRSARRIADQVLRSGTSTGANYEEGRAAESREDFAHKMQVALKELRETRYWIRLASGTKLVEPARLASFLQESDELIRILTRTVVTVKRNLGVLPPA